MTRIVQALIVLCITMNMGCAHVGKTLGEWLARAEEIGAVRCADFSADPRGYAVCMGEAGSDAAILTAAERLRSAVRRALSLPAPGAGAEADDAERDAARIELADALKAWEGAVKGR